jgi:hypothetical protein
MADSFYQNYVESLKEDFPNAEKAFVYFCEQAHYDNIIQFLEEYGNYIDGLEEFVDRADYQKGMDDLYADTILKNRRKNSLITMM